METRRERAEAVRSGSFAASTFPELFQADSRCQPAWLPAERRQARAGPSGAGREGTAAWMEPDGAAGGRGGRVAVNIAVCLRGWVLVSHVYIERYSS